MNRLRQLQVYALVMSLLLLGTSLYVISYQTTFNIKWLVILVISVLYFNSEAISKKTGMKVFYIVMLVLFYILSKFLETSFLILTVNAWTATLLFVLFLSVFFLATFFRNRRKSK